MKILTYKDKGYEAFVNRLRRRAIPEDAVRDRVGDIISAVAIKGDDALVELTHRFDGAKLTKKELFVSEKEFADAEAAVSPATREAIRRSLRNIHSFARKSMRKDWSGKNAEGATVGERFTPFDRVGVYVPGGKAPLVSTALMTAGFAQAAGVPEIFAATPCGADGKVNPALLYALQQAGVTEAVKVGGAQAIAAMALGTKTIRPVDRIFGPGNRFVVEAKRQLVGAVSIDLLPGPSEILILADASAKSAYIAADLLAGALRQPCLATQVRRLRPGLRHVIHVRPLSVNLLQVREVRCARPQPSHVVVLKKGLFVRPKLLGMLMHLEAQPLVTWRGVKLAQAPGAVALARHRLRKVRTAPRCYVLRGLPVAKPPGAGGLAPRHQTVARRHTDRTRGVGIGAAKATRHEPV